MCASAAAGGASASQTPAPAPSRGRRAVKVGQPMLPSVAQRVYTLVGALGTPCVAFFSFLFGRKPKPCATKLPTRCARCRA
jgi:hypothetical protein